MSSWVISVRIESISGSAVAVCILITSKRNPPELVVLEQLKDPEIPDSWMVPTQMSVPN
jgi:hypothetical protein